MTDMAMGARPAVPAGEQAMARLADRLAAMTPAAPLELTHMQALSMPRPSPAVAAALGTSARIAARAAERARRSRSVVGLMVDGFVGACSLLPYALVALALRLTLARVFFLDGQSRIDGPRVPLTVQDFNFSALLPAQVKAETLTAFLTNVPPLPVPPALAAHVVSYAEFALPILLVLGLATRFAAVGLLALTAMMQLYLMPEALWTVHVYWAAMLAVLISLGGGQLSIDAIIRVIARR